MTDSSVNINKPILPAPQPQITGHSFLQKLRQSRTGFLFFAPNLLGFVIFFAIPVVWSLYLSFTQYDGFFDPVWVGTQNYENILFNDPFSADPPYYFWKSLWNTVYYCMGYIPVSIGLSLFLAILLNANLKGMKIFRAIYFLPVVSSVVAVSIVWNWMFSVDNGPINEILVAIGGESWRLGWLDEPETAMLGIIIMAIWRTLGYNLIIILAALQGVPRDLYEAAYVDGATRWQIVRKITIPMISPALFFVFLMSLITGMQVFSEAYVMTNGGPARSTLTVVYNLYQQGFSFLDFGISSAMGWVVFLMIFTIAMTVNFFSRRWVHYT